MIGLAVIGTGSLPQALVEALHTLVPKADAEDVLGLTVDRLHDLNQQRETLVTAVNRLDQGEGVLLLADIYGGVGETLATSIMERCNIYVVAGVSLAMLTGVIEDRRVLKPTLPQLAEYAAERGRNGVLILSQDA